MDGAAQRVDSFDARSFEIAAEQIVGRPTEPEDRLAERVRLLGFWAQGFQLLDDFRPERHRALVFVLRRALAE